MSASERLRALTAEARVDRISYDVLHSVQDALPLIADVVEAAERASAQWDTPERYIGTAMADVRQALTALREALDDS